MLLSASIFAPCNRERAKEKVLNHGPAEGRLALLTCGEERTVLAFILVMVKSKKISELCSLPERLRCVYTQNSKVIWIVTFALLSVG